MIGEGYQEIFSSLMSWAKVQAFVQVALRGFGLGAPVIDFPQPEIHAVMILRILGQWP